MSTRIEGMDSDDLAYFSNWLETTGKGYSKRAKAMLRQEGNKLKRRTKQKARIVHKQTGRYDASIKRGKVWTHEENTTVRVYSGAPHAHLVEDGHEQIMNPPKRHGRGVQPGKGIGWKVGYVPGRRVFAQAYEAFGPEFERDCEDFIDKEIAKL